jgi:SsrA-binding protein
MEDLVSNRRAFHNYEILETIESGIVLLGTEIKSLRNHGGNIRDAYVVFNGREAFVKNCSISAYKYGNLFNHEEKRDRKLLLHKREILKLRMQVEEKGLSIIPIAFYLKKGFVKVRLGLACGKKTYDKRAAIKARDDKRAIARSMKQGEA